MSPRKKYEVATLYFPTRSLEPAQVRPASAVFSYEELSAAVGGMIQQLVAAKRGLTVWANEEGLLLGLMPNVHTHELANMRVYQLNGYGASWLAVGRLFVVEKTVARPDGTLPTIDECLRRTATAQKKARA